MNNVTGSTSIRAALISAVVTLHCWRWTIPVRSNRPPRRPSCRRPLFTGTLPTQVNNKDNDNGKSETYDSAGGSDVRSLVPVLVVTHLSALGVGYAIADKRPVATLVQNTGFLQVDTTKVLAATVESLREENRLLVFS
ncbi:hypothetical protein KZX46_20845 [Polymorphobacter sp. PAMC 29334]|nr:hypothetical protein KZX46_20845 [Polymorphobacter sp. PAMC 29334]